MAKPIYILNLETSTKNCSVSISKNGKIIALKEIAEVNFSHAENLPKFIEETLKESSLKLKDLSAVAIGKGPGSFTGLRIGVSSAKGFCFGLDIPLISIPTLAILAYASKSTKGFIIPMLDARRLEVFSCVFDVNYKLVSPTNNELLDENPFNEYLEKDKVIFIGDAVQKTKEIITHKNADFIEAFPSAKEMAKLSFEKFIKQDFENVAYFEPFYLKDFKVTVSKKNLLKK